MAGAPLIARIGRNYAWVIVAALTVLLGASHGLITSGMSVFDKAILDDLGIGRGALKFREFLQLIAGGLWAVAIGYIAERVGPRAIIYVGLAALSAVLFAYGHIATIEQTYPLHLLIAFAYSSCHVVIVMLILTRWFAARRSVALGIILAGESLGGTLFPQIIVRLVADEGWRQAMQQLALMPLVLAIILLLTLRRDPAQIGTGRYGEDIGEEAATGPRNARPELGSFNAYLVQPGALLLFLAAASLFYAGGGFVGHAFLSFQDRGFDPATAASTLSLIFIMAFAGKLLSGFLAEKFGLARVWMTSQLLLLCGGLTFTFATGHALWIGVAALGLGWGGCYTLTHAIVMERFSGPWLARLSGIAVFIEGIGAGLGTWLSGLIFDATGSYTVPFLVVCGVVGMAFAASFQLTRSAGRVRPATA